MDRIILIGVGLLASLFFNSRSYFLPAAGSKTVEVVHAETRFVEVAPGYEGWYQHDGATVRNWSSVDQTVGKFEDEEDEDGNLEDGNSDDGSSDDGSGEVDEND